MSNNDNDNDKIRQYRASHELPEDKGMSFEDNETTRVFAKNADEAEKLAYDSFAFEPESEIEVTEI